MWKSVIALNKNGTELVSVSIHGDETVSDMLLIISDSMTENAQRRRYLDQWIEGGRMIKFKVEV